MYVLACKRKYLFLQFLKNAMNSLNREGVASEKWCLGPPELKYTFSKTS